MNEKSARNCFLFFFNNRSKLNLNIIKKSKDKKRRKNVLTILKSPHVNKAAQEQFESRLFSKQINIHALKSKQFLLILKRIKTYLFPDVKIKTKFILNKNLMEKARMNVLNPSNFKLNALKQIKLTRKINAKNEKCRVNKILILAQTKHFLKVFDIFSEFQKL